MFTNELGHLTSQLLWIYTVKLERTCQEVYMTQDSLPFAGHTSLVRINVNENMIRTLSLILNDITESVAKTVAAQHESLVSGQSCSFLFFLRYMNKN